eukprot:TRINITY_DN10291_c0_g2_i1.p1 TRINITY_DN10291_c0_g2~~TRINITY_DN10291_c0_g2_i1.p1  ORF type:complete len:488 (+),score=110.19 TRINITY_DN10291_c0_g2_i1:118-1581(+)
MALASSPLGRGVAGAAAVVVAAAGVALLSAALQRWRQERGGAPAEEPYDVCKSALQGADSGAQLYDLPEVVAVNWGQAEGPYSLPPERLVICADGQGFVWRAATAKDASHVAAAGSTGSGHDSNVRRLDAAEVAELFKTLLSVWPQGAEARGVEDGNFLWVLDTDYNLLVAPTVQRRLPGQELTEIKHGDLCPGLDFIGRGGVTGPFRGVARMAGEFNLAGNRDGSEWIMHTKSGYSGSRVPLAKATRYYREMRDAGQSDAEIGRNFAACVMKDLFLARLPLRRTFCYLCRRLGVRASPGETRRCDITNKSVSVPSHGGLPDLIACDLRAAGEAPACEGEADGEDAGRAISAAEGQRPWLGLDSHRPSPDRPLVHLLYWIAPGQADPCEKTIHDFDVDMKRIDEEMRRAAKQPKDIGDEIKFIRKHVCLTDKYFLEQLQCNVHGCFGEGFTERLKKVEDALSSGVGVPELWSSAMDMWSDCVQSSSV